MMNSSNLKGTDDNIKKIQEGQAEILNNDQDAFYNPIQTFNRDLRYEEIIIRFDKFHSQIRSLRLLIEQLCFN